MYIYLDVHCVPTITLKKILFHISYCVFFAFWAAAAANPDSWHQKVPLRMGNQIFRNISGNQASPVKQFPSSKFCSALTAYQQTSCHSSANLDKCCIVEHIFSITEGAYHATLKIQTFLLLCFHTGPKRCNGHKGVWTKHFINLWWHLQSWDNMSAQLSEPRHLYYSP
jgi:hypothetical protein